MRVTDMCINGFITTFLSHLQNSCFIKQKTTRLSVVSMSELNTYQSAGFTYHFVVVMNHRKCTLFMSFQTLLFTLLITQQNSTLKQINPNELSLLSFAISRTAHSSQIRANFELRCWYHFCEHVS